MATGWLIVVIGLRVGETHAIVDFESWEAMPHRGHKLIRTAGLVVGTERDRAERIRVGHDLLKRARVARTEVGDSRRSAELHGAGVVGFMKPVVGRVKR